MSTQEINQPTNKIENNADSERNNGSTAVSESSSFRCTVHSCLPSNGNIKFVDSIPSNALRDVGATRNDNTCSSNATICIRDNGSTTKNSGGIVGDAENSNPCASPNKCVPPRESLQPCPDGYEYVANNHGTVDGMVTSLPSCLQKGQSTSEPTGSTNIADDGNGGPGKNSIRSIMRHNNATPPAIPAGQPTDSVTKAETGEHIAQICDRDCPGLLNLLSPVENCTWYILFSWCDTPEDPRITDYNLHTPHDTTPKAIVLSHLPNSGGRCAPFTCEAAIDVYRSGGSYFYNSFVAWALSQPTLDPTPRNRILSFLPSDQCGGLTCSALLDYLADTNHERYNDVVRRALHGEFLPPIPKPVANPPPARDSKPSPLHAGSSPPPAVHFTVPPTSPLPHALSTRPPFGPKPCNNEGDDICPIGRELLDPARGNVGFGPYDLPGCRKNSNGKCDSGRPGGIVSKPLFSGRESYQRYL